jgi:hypothetical protein
MSDTPKGRTCRDCALHTVTYRADIEEPGNEYEMGTCHAPRWAYLPDSRSISDPFAAKCKHFEKDPPPPRPGIGFF